MRNVAMALFIILLIISGCKHKTKDLSSTNESVEANLDIENPYYQDEDLQDHVININDRITFSQNKITSTNRLINIQNQLVTITHPGTYELQGTIDNLQIIIDTDKSEQVTLVLNNVNITSTNGPVIYAKNSDKLIINIKENTINYLNDLSIEEVSSCIYSKNNLTINGTGTLYINGEYGHGIHSNKRLTITNGHIIVNAEKDALKAKDFIMIRQATLELFAGKDAIHSSHSKDTNKGSIVIESGIFNIRSNEDGLDSSSKITIFDGTFTIKSGIESESGKGIKATNIIHLLNGRFTISSHDDSLHSNNITIYDGFLELSSNDDGVHADHALTIHSGTIKITDSYEGIEARHIKINNGNIYVNAKSDGVNAAGITKTQLDASLEINDGYLFINALGDGIDVNGSIVMNDGTVLVSGPTKNNNGAIDYDTTFTIHGGLLIAVGSVEMAKNVSNTSTQHSVLITLSSSTSELFRLETSEGQDIATFAPPKSYQTIVISSNQLKNGNYNLYLGGTINHYSALTDGLYIGGNHLNGTLVQTFTLTSIVSSIKE